jgi:hypothetical protein
MPALMVIAAERELAVIFADLQAIPVSRAGANLGGGNPNAGR